jgi:hypothetical protein
VSTRKCYPEFDPVGHRRKTLGLLNSEDPDSGTVGKTQKNWYANEEFLTWCPGERDTGFWTQAMHEVEDKSIYVMYYRNLNDWNTFSPQWLIGETA